MATEAQVATRIAELEAMLASSEEKRKAAEEELAKRPAGPQPITLIGTRVVAQGDKCGYEADGNAAVAPRREFYFGRRNGGGEIVGKVTTTHLQLSHLDAISAWLDAQRAQPVA